MKLAITARVDVAEGVTVRVDRVSPRVFGAWLHDLFEDVEESNNLLGAEPVPVPKVTTFTIYDVEAQPSTAPPPPIR